MPWPRFESTGERPGFASSRLSTCGPDAFRVACLATGLSVPCKPFVSCGRSHFFELIWDIVASAEVNLVGSLTTERRVRKTRVVLAHIERDQQTAKFMVSHKRAGSSGAWMPNETGADMIIAFENSSARRVTSMDRVLLR